MPAEVKIFSSLAEVDGAAWNACFRGELENYDYLLAVEQATLPDFIWRYVCVADGAKILAAAPAFLTDYHLDTTLDDGALRRAIRAIKKIVPGFLRLKLGSLGSPLMEHGKIGFHPDIHPEQKSALIKQLIQGFEQHAQAAGCKMLGIKDIPNAEMPAWQAPCAELGYTGLPGMPTGHVAISFASEDGYFKTLSRMARKDVRRKLRSQSDIRTEIRTDISDMKDQIYQLYLQTKTRSEFQFETLTADYFTAVLQHMPREAFYVLYFVGAELIGANLLLQNKTTLLDKFFCMSPRGRDHDLYFISWMENIRYAIAHGQTTYNSGQASPETKRHLGATIRPTQMLFRHISPIWNQVLKGAAPMFAMGD
jgi:predicted N-acyltransferase